MENITFNESIFYNIFETSINDYDIVKNYCDSLPLFLLDYLIKYFIIFLIIDNILKYTKYYQRAINVYFKAQYFMFIYVVYTWLSYNHSGFLDTVNRFSNLIYFLLIILSTWAIYKNWDKIKEKIKYINSKI